MGRTKPSKPRGKQQAPPEVDQPRPVSDGDQGADAAPSIRWTPLEQACGCVAEWGWDGRNADPHTFMAWTSTRPVAPCPWHAETLAGTEGKDLPDTLVVQPHGTDVLIHVRRAAADRHELGRELSRCLAALFGLIADGEQAVLEQIPAGYRNWLANNTPAPANAWVDQRLMEILLNHGRTALPPEVLENLPILTDEPEPEPEPEPRTVQTAEQNGTDDPGTSCTACAIANAWGGIVCDCGHDWACHPGSAGNEPCSHCACADMQTTLD
ncbi:hypothetical protein ACIRJS_27440 [Streptomyces sp. NPDC102340]|uniref:hypothetical protein n=1 Tax=unclassified Streptomyces TaxID=2593676 RepID=UPI0038284EFA